MQVCEQILLHVHLDEDDSSLLALIEDLETNAVLGTGEASE